MYYSVSVGCQCKDNSARPPHLFCISVQTKPAPGTQLSEYTANPLVTMSYLKCISIDNKDIVFTAILDSGATNCFVHSKVVQQLNATTVDIPAMTVTLADCSFIDCSNAFPLYLKLCGNIQSCSSGLSKNGTCRLSSFVLRFSKFDQ